MKNSKHKGSTFESFLEEEDILDDVEAVAIKRVIAFQILQGMKKAKITKSKMASQMHTSRSALDRILDPSYTSVTLSSLVKAASLLGKKLDIKLV